MENRTLRLDPDNAGFYYEYEICTGIWPFHKCRWQTDRYDLTNKDQRLKLIHMKFKARVLE